MPAWYCFDDLLANPPPVLERQIILCTVVYAQFGRWAQTIDLIDATVTSHEQETESVRTVSI